MVMLLRMLTLYNGQTLGRLIGPQLWTWETRTMHLMLLHQRLFFSQGSQIGLQLLSLLFGPTFVSSTLRKAHFCSVLVLTQCTHLTLRFLLMNLMLLELGKTLQLVGEKQAGLDLSLPQERLINSKLTITMLELYQVKYHLHWTLYQLQLFHRLFWFTHNQKSITSSI